jgi:drug/metabolite transporter (DMT)-like permease
MDDEKKALFYGLSAVLLWSTVATAFKLTLREFTPVQMLAFASYISVLALLLICSLQRKTAQIWPTFCTNPLFFITLGIINPFAYYLILFKAYALLPASQAQTINYSWAITLTFMSAVFLKQTIRKQDYLAAIIC